MSKALLCHCNHIAVPAVIEGSSVLVCRHLLRGSQYRMDPYHVPCGFRLVADTGHELEPRVRAAVLYRRPEPFKALSLPQGSGPLDFYRPKSEVAADNSRAQVVENAMEIDDDAPIEGASFVDPEQGSPMDLRALQKRYRMLERQLQASEEERVKQKQRITDLEEDMQTLVEQCQAKVRAKEEEADRYRKKYEGARTELHNLRRSARNIVSSGWHPYHRSSPNPI